VGIRTLGELAALDPESARQLLGSQGPGLVARAAGIDDRPVGEDSAVKSVSNEHTFARDVRERAEVEAEVRRLAQKVASRLRRKGLQGRTLTVKLRYADFTTRSASRTIAQPTDLEQVLVPVALDLIGEVWTAGAGLRLLGFGVSGFGRATTQLELLAESPRDGRPEALAHSIDAVRSRFGPGSIGFGKLKSAEHAGEED
jgi:DNA polymerase-4